MTRSTLSCCLVVKNEEKKIKSCLDNIDILSDEIVIVDTGSKDKTCDIINQWITQKNAHNSVKLIKAGNRFHDEDGDFNFGAAKTFSFQNATKDYVMWLDASDVVTDQKTIKQIFLKETQVEADSYFVLPTALLDNYAFSRVRIGRRKYSRMDGRIHEAMKFSVENKLRRVFIPVTINNSIRHTKGERRDLKRNLRILKKEWDDKKTSRSCFYVANSYRELGRLDESLKWFRKRVYDFEFKNEYREEFFKSLECMAELTLSIGNSGSVTIEDLYDIAKEMIEKEPTRVEGYYYLGQYYVQHKQWDKALTELNKYKECKRPENYKLWLNQNIYNGASIMNAIEKCLTAKKYKGVIQPEAVEDLHPAKSTYKRGNSQYY